jgi:hypothetical protein
MQNPVRTGYPPSLSEGLPQKLFDFINDCTKKTEKEEKRKKKNRHQKNFRNMLH